MDKLAFNYPLSTDAAGNPTGMILLELLLWIVLLTLAGFAARKIVRGKSVLGLWGDILFGLLGVFLVGSLMKAFGFSIARQLGNIDLGPLNDVTRWVDIAIVAFLGALIIRAIARPITGKG